MKTINSIVEVWLLVIMWMIPFVEQEFQKIYYNSEHIIDPYVHIIDTI